MSIDPASLEDLVMSAIKNPPDYFTEIPGFMGSLQVMVWYGKGGGVFLKIPTRSMSVSAKDGRESTRLMRRFAEEILKAFPEDRA